MSLALPPAHYKLTTDRLRGHILAGGQALGERLMPIKRPRRDKRLEVNDDGAAIGLARVAEKLTALIEADDISEVLAEQTLTTDCATDVKELVLRWLARAHVTGGGLFDGSNEYLCYHKDGHDAVCASGVTASGEEIFNLVRSSSVAPSSVALYQHHPCH